MFAESHIPKTLRQILSQYCTPTEELVREFENAARLVEVKKGKAIVRQGVLCDDFVFNKQGLFRVSHVSDGKEDTVLFGTSGDVFTSLHSYYAGEPSIFSLIAVEDSEAWLVSYRMMRQLEARHPAMLKWMHDLLIEQMYGFEKRYLFFNNKTAEERFLNFMRIHSVSLRRTSVKYISSIVPLKYIAQYLKITQSTLSRLRKKLVGQG
ncbi:MAG: Crp/Fnr family transcriptional regulator [Bacteroidales bacterium]|nr:Crp/Fnr family transcriptional regulator [Bacteroidales bacterium]MBD5288929.1 Crp/Fnr family transcriptional regulator [Bacteroides sp.]MDE6254836.1 Crp/Fnr family transcriptional regulator [Muribaculaceae bacterium]